MKKQLYFLLSVVVIIFLAVIVNNWIESNKEEQRLIRQEQERMVEYTLENFEDIRKIEFTSFEQNFSTKTWSAKAIINNKIFVSYSVDAMEEEDPIRIIADISYNEYREGALKERNSEETDKNTRNIEVIYKKG